MENLNFRKKLKIPNNAYKYILLQRTQLQKFNKAGKKITGSEYNSFWLNLDVLLRKKQVKSGFWKSIEDDYDILLPYLPTSPEQILDIGCGLAGIDVFLNDLYQGKSKFVLLDKSKIQDKIFYGIEKEGAFYNSLKVAKQILTENGLSADKITLLEAENKHGIHLPDKSVDLVISLISWGYHYPIDVYLDEVLRVLKNKGVLIVDIRKGTDGVEKIENKFKTKIEIIQDTTKFKRIKCIL